MGWAGGSQLADEVWNIVSKYIPAKDRPAVAHALCAQFQNEDCDTMDECEFVNEYLEYDDGEYRLK